jgi:phytoene dehydrogenase-like protein
MSMSVPGFSFIFIVILSQQLVQLRGLLLQPQKCLQSSRKTQFLLTQIYASERSQPIKSDKPKQQAPADIYDVVVVGSGIGGLSCAAMLAKYGYSVAVLESHYAPGGAAHGFTVREQGVGDFHFDTGPSFFSGINPSFPPKTSNPLRTVLDAIDERVECEAYSSFGLILPEGEFIHDCNFGRPGGVVDSLLGMRGVQQWDRLMRNMEPLEAAVDALPIAALRQDFGALLTTASYLPKFAKLNPLNNLKLTKMFQSILDESGIDGFLQNWLDLLCFCLSGLPASGTVTAEMALMLGEFYQPGALMDWPKGGARSIVDSLVRGIEKHGGHLFTNAHVSKIVVEGSRAVGVQLKKGGRVVRTRHAVISNLSVWDLYGSGILEPNAFSDKEVKSKLLTPVGKSFMHLHLGFKITPKELEDLEAHYIYLDDWDRGVEAQDNAVLVSIPSVHDNSLAPDGYGVLHAYTPATEDYSRWKGMDRKSPEYCILKEERSQYLWHILEKIIPDIRERTVVSRVGTPLTHERFLNRFKGSYGPGTTQGLSFPKTSLNNLLVCGDSCFPGIGVPAACASGFIAANSVSLQSVVSQMNLLAEKHRR